MIRFIDEYRNRFSVEFICKTLQNNRAGGFIAPRGYRQSKARTSCGCLTLRMCARRMALCMPRLSPMFTRDGSLGGRYQIPCAPKRCHCKLSTRRLCVLRIQQVSFIFRITACSTSALSTTSVLPSTRLPLPPETVGDSYDNALAENVNGSYKNELIHTRRWNDVVEVEIEFWEQHPPLAIIEIKANA